MLNNTWRRWGAGEPALDGVLLDVAHGCGGASIISYQATGGTQRAHWWDMYTERTIAQEGVVESYLLKELRK